MTPSLLGRSLREMLVSYEELLGPELVAQTKARLSAPAREAIERATVSSWVPMEHVSELIDRLGIEAARDPDALLDEVIPRTLDRTFKSSWRVLLRFASDEALIARAPALWAKGRNAGRLASRLVSPGVGEVELTEWPGIGDRDLRTLALTLEGVMRIAGRERVRVVREPAPDGGRFRLTWG